jgi:hypothetical protein
VAGKEKWREKEKSMDRRCEGTAGDVLGLVRRVQLTTGKEKKSFAILVGGSRQVAKTWTVIHPRPPRLIFREICMREAHATHLFARCEAS